MISEVSISGAQSFAPTFVGQSADLFQALPYRSREVFRRRRLNGYLALRALSRFLASSFRMCLNCEVLKGMLPWRTKYPLSQVPIKPVPILGARRCPFFAMGTPLLALLGRC